MYKVFTTIPGGIFSAATQFFRPSKKIDHATLSRCILGISKSRGLLSIFNQGDACLQELLNYRLFAVVLQKNNDFHIWSSISPCNVHLYEKIRNDLGRPKNITRHTLGSDIYPLCNVEDLRSFTLVNDVYSVRFYWFSHENKSQKPSQVFDSIIRAMEIAISITLEMEKLRKEAAFDRLTNTYSRREFDRIIEHSIANSQRHNRNLSIIMLDIDHFKRVNDIHGHLVGDAVLKEVAQILSASIRKGDYLARYGGEEFIVILPETKMIRAIELAERLRKAIETTRIPVSSGNLLKVTASFGVSSLKRDSDTESLIKEADDMMYRAKTHGRNVVMPGVKLHGRPTRPASKKTMEQPVTVINPHKALEQIAQVPEL
jgi:diguanylate cyclase (GGDEF)-like protein